MVMTIIVVMLVMVIMVIRTDRKTRTNRTDRTDRYKTDRSELDFPGNMCRAAFAILVMFVNGLVWITCSTWEEKEQL